MCKHDPIYQRENEAQGGAGCPLCHRERRAGGVMPPAGICPVCGRAADHDWQECAEEDYREWRAAQADRAALLSELRQF